MSLFGTDIFPYSTSFAKLHVHINFNLPFLNNKHIIFFAIVYSIILMLNISSFALNVLRVTWSVTKLFTSFTWFQIHLQLNYNLIVSWFCLQVKMFLETMVLYPPVVSVAGFANVDKGMFRAVSYLTKNWSTVRNSVTWFCFVTASCFTYQYAEVD
jgi:hypothetical protein